MHSRRYQNHQTLTGLVSRLKMPWLRGTIWGVMALTCHATALAQDSGAQVYRCGNSYQTKACAGGVAVDTSDARSAAQQREAHRLSQQDAATAKRLATERERHEREASKHAAANVGPVAAKAPATAASKPQHPTRKKKLKLVTTKPAKAKG